MSPVVHLVKNGYRISSNNMTQRVASAAVVPPNTFVHLVQSVLRLVGAPSVDADAAVRRYLKMSDW